MATLEMACRLIEDELVMSLPENVTAPKLSKQYYSKIEKLDRSTKRIYSFTLSSRTFKMILVAAIILALMSISAVAYVSTYNYKFGDTIGSGFDSYFVCNDKTAKNVRSLTVNTVADGYCLGKEEKRPISYKQIYYKDENDQKEYYVVEKWKLNHPIAYEFNHNPYEKEKINYDGVDYILYNGEDYCGLVWNKNGYIYLISGYLTKEEILSVAYSTN